MSRPPDKPPPVLHQNLANAGVPQGEQMEMTQYTASEVHPMPYERVVSSMPRYSMEPGTKPNKREWSPIISPNSAQGAREHAGTEHTGPEYTAPTYADPEQEEPPDSDHDIYYSRLKFLKPGRGFSTSTHIYGDLGSHNTSASSSYISPQQLEPFFSKSAEEVTEKETGVEESTGYTSSDYLPSGWEEGSYSDDITDDEGCVAESLAPTRQSLEELNSRIGKSPATGQMKGDSDEIEYINTRRELNDHREEIQEGEGAQGSEDEVKYMNTLHPGAAAMNMLRSAAATRTADINQTSIKSAPDISPKKQTRRSTPTQWKNGAATYTGLIHETCDYTSVYSNTLHRNDPEN